MSMAESGVMALRSCRFLLGEAERLDGCRIGIELKAGKDSGRVGSSKCPGVLGILPFEDRSSRSVIFLFFVVPAMASVAGVLRFRTGFPEASASAGRVGLGRSFI